MLLIKFFLQKINSFSMKRSYYFIFTFVYLFSLFSCENDKITIEIKSTLIKNGKLFNKVEFQNNTNDKLYFPIITSEMLIPYHNVRSQSEKPLESLFSQSLIILIYDKKGEIISGTYGIDYDYFGNKSDKEMFDSIGFYLFKTDTIKLKIKEKSFLKNQNPKQAFQYFNIKNESFYVNPRSNITIDFKSHLNYSSTRAGLLLDGLSFYPIDKLEEKTNYNLLLNIDSVLVKKNLPKEFIDSLHRNQIKIFHGTINSNKVSLKIKE